MSMQSKVKAYMEDLERTRGQLQQFRESEGRLRVQLQEALSATAAAQVGRGFKSFSFREPSIFQFEL